jgi:hypothetical protein
MAASNSTVGDYYGFSGTRLILCHGQDLPLYQNAIMRFPASSRLLKKSALQAAQKDLRGEAREKSTSGGVLSQYVAARRLSATKHKSLFQQPASR